jgi:hypothetical protein
LRWRKSFTDLTGWYQERLEQLSASLGIPPLYPALADRPAHLPSSFLHLRLSNAGPATIVRVAKISDGVGIRNLSH